MTEFSLKFCPVPFEQQPINEYEELQKSWLFSWAKLPLFCYLRNLILVGFFSLLISSPISAASFPLNKAMFSFIISSFLGSYLVIILLLIRLYLGWSYIGDRLNKEKIIYEESGWYDGEEWEKPLELLERDRLIFVYQIKPILIRLKKSALMVLSLIMVFLLLLIFV